MSYTHVFHWWFHPGTYVQVIDEFSSVKQPYRSKKTVGTTVSKIIEQSKQFTNGSLGYLHKEQTTAILDIVRIALSLVLIKIKKDQKSYHKNISVHTASQ